VSGCIVQARLKRQRGSSKGPHLELPFSRIEEKKRESVQEHPNTAKQGGRSRGRKKYTQEGGTVATNQREFQKRAKDTTQGEGKQAQVKKLEGKEPSLTEQFTEDEGLGWDCSAEGAGSGISANRRDTYQRKTMSRPWGSLGSTHGFIAYSRDPKELNTEVQAELPRSG